MTPQWYCPLEQTCLFPETPWQSPRVLILPLLRLAFIRLFGHPLPPGMSDGMEPPFPGPRRQSVSMVRPIVQCRWVEIRAVWPN